MPLPADMAAVLARTGGHFGWVTPAARTPDQHAAHSRALAVRAAFSLTYAAPPVGTKIILSSLWADPLCVADMGATFTGFRQLTGSCVGVSAGNAAVTLSCVQRKLAAGATKAMIPFWGYDYGKTRHDEGDRGQGEGAIDSVMFESMKSGVLDSKEPGLPTFDTSDGWALSSSQEMAWSDGGSQTVTKWAGAANKYPLGSAATLSSTDDIIAAILNGYPVLDGCDKYVGNGNLQGGVCLGQYDGNGGHSTTLEGYWNHESLGELILYGNQWAGSTYPEDGSGKRRCSVWMKRASVDRLWQLGGSGGETAALSHLTYLPAQPEVLNPDLWA